MKKVLIVYAHPDSKSFNHAILEQTLTTLRGSGHEATVLDLYALQYNPVLSYDELKGAISEETADYQKAIAAATDLIFIFPVWWFRAPAILEGFIDKTFTPKFAYRFKPLIGKLALPVPLLSDKSVTVLVTHGAPALPVRTLYVNAVKYRFLLGFLSFCFNIFKCRIRQFWSVPFSSAETRARYLLRVDRLLRKRLPASELPERKGTVHILGSAKKEDAAL